MRTTVNLDDDVVTAVERARREHGEGLSPVINRLIRRGLRNPQPPAAFVQRAESLGLRIDVANVGEALDLLDSSVLA